MSDDVGSIVFIAIMLSMFFFAVYTFVVLQPLHDNDYINSQKDCIEAGFDYSKDMGTGGGILCVKNNGLKVNYYDINKLSTIKKGVVLLELDMNKKQEGECEKLKWLIFV